MRKFLGLVFAAVPAVLDLVMLVFRIVACVVTFVVLIVCAVVARAIRILPFLMFLAVIAGVVYLLTDFHTAATGYSLATGASVIGSNMIIKMMEVLFKKKKDVDVVRFGTKHLPEDLPHPGVVYVFIADYDAYKALKGAATLAGMWFVLLEYQPFGFSQFVYKIIVFGQKAWLSKSQYDDLKERTKDF